MQYLVSVIDDGTGPATPTEDAAIDGFNDRDRRPGGDRQLVGLVSAHAAATSGTIPNLQSLVAHSSAICHCWLQMDAGMGDVNRREGGV